MFSFDDFQPLSQGRKKILTIGCSMGTRVFHPKDQSNKITNNCEISFSDFEVLRAIGKGGFGKVCIVQKKFCKKMFAMKYMNKVACIEKHAVSNVMREIRILLKLNHPFIVNLWYTFQDNEDLFVVVDLLTGGDIRFHSNNQALKFSEKTVKLYICEISLVLDYLQSKRIIHRDIKPENLLLDENGHIHLTDFNVATELQSSKSYSICGTKPYMAYEFFSDNLCNTGYSYEVDWWSLGVVAFELLVKKRPFKIQSNSSINECRQIIENSQFYSHRYSDFVSGEMYDLIFSLLRLESEYRISCLKKIQENVLLKDVNWNQVVKKQIEPEFKPSSSHLNCDPTFELEEMIIESKPLHKKEKRLAKQHKNHKNQMNSELKEALENLEKEFTVFNRESFLEKEENEKNFNNSIFVN